MLHEKHNEPFEWKRKLDELDHLPNEREKDRTVAWEKLHTRLAQKAVARSAAWYWIAAAGALIIAGLFWNWPKQPRNAMVNTANRAVTEQPTRKLKIAREEKYPNASREPIPARKTPRREIVVPIKKHRNVAITTGTEATTRTVKEDSLTKMEAVPMITAQDKATGDTVETKLFTVSPAKKLRVVHINDLVKPKEELPLAKVLLQTPLPRRISGHEDLPVFSVSKNASDNILKIKLSPSN